MKPSDALKSVIFSWDFGLSLVLGVLVVLLMHDDVTVQIAKDIFEISVSVLAIIFSVFFAGLAVLITAGDNEFVRFLEEDGAYRAIIWTFKFTLFLLFCALLLAIVLFVSVLPFVNAQVIYIFPKWLLVVFVFLTSYSLFAAFNSSLDTIRYAEYRARFIEITQKDNDKAP